MKAKAEKKQDKKPAGTAAAKKAIKKVSAGAAKALKASKKISGAKAEPKAKKTSLAETSKKKPAPRKKVGTTAGKKDVSKPKKTVKITEKTPIAAKVKAVTRKPAATEKVKKKEIKKIAAKKPARKVAVKATKTLATRGKTAGTASARKAPKKIKETKEAPAKKVAAKKVSQPSEKPARRSSSKSQARPRVKSVEKTSAMPAKKEPGPVKKAAEATGESMRKPLMVISEESIIQPFKAKLKIFLPAEGEPEPEAQEIYYEELPEEYGENELFIMAVDPHVVYASWEITKKDVPSGEIRLILRFYDVTETEIDVPSASAFNDMSLDKRVGSGYFDVQMPGREVLAEIGFLEKTGKYKVVLRSNRVLLPPLLVADELGIYQKLVESGIPVGY